VCFVSPDRPPVTACLQAASASVDIVGDTEAQGRRARQIAQIRESLTHEDPQRYPQHREQRFGVMLRLPPSWQETQGFIRGDTLLRVFVSPPVAMDGRDTVRAALTLTVEPSGDGGLAGYYQRKRDSLGDAFVVVKHEAWRDGYVDTIVTETAVMTSRIKRFYRVANGRGYCLAFEAREDVFARAAGWFDLIAGTLEIAPPA
jgi:hypothetical protein